MGSFELSFSRRVPILDGLRCRFLTFKRRFEGGRRGAAGGARPAAAFDAPPRQGGSGKVAASQARDQDHVPLGRRAEVVVQAPPAAAERSAGKGRGLGVGRWGRGGDGVLEEAAVAHDATPKMLQPPVPLRGRRPQPGQHGRDFGGSLWQAARAGPAFSQAFRRRPPGSRVFPVHADPRLDRGCAPLQRLRVPPPRRLDEPRAAQREHPGVQRAVFKSLLLPHVDARRRPRRQPADGRHVHPFRQRLEPAG
mmetsp:Transcript_17698/g.59662  ORF Transcript_17698/g.59662 Transcript_17698/m.59662 type:complete len:251 (-) Transcript_17698:2254-3006(-)